MAFGIELIGYFAGICTSIAQVPQAIKVIKTGDTSSISIVTYGLMTFGILCWFVYAVLIYNVPMLVANGVCFIPSVIVFYVTLVNHYKSK
jgi:MtN3 and saliva related transmembrane protein